MKRKVGITALIFAAIFFLLTAAAMPAKAMGVGIFCVIMYFACALTAVICLFGDVVRFIGKMFSAGFSEGAAKSYNHYCPQCGKGLEQDAHFCPGCGTKLK